MIVFHGGFTKEQVEKLKNNEPIIYEKIPYKEARAGGENTFDYVPKELYDAPLHIFKRYISENCFYQQYIFLAKYLQAVLEFCHNTDEENYIMVCNIDENILNQYIGVGNYIDYRIEYRLPRRFINSDNIIEFLYFEPYNRDQMKLFEEKYPSLYYIDKKEDENAKKLIRQKKLQFNKDRDWK